MLSLESISLEIKNGGLRLFEYAKHISNTDWSKCRTKMKVEGIKQQGNLR